MTEEQEVDIYAFFQIPKDSNEELIKKTYKKLALKYHPDKLISKDSSSIKEITKKFQLLTDYYTILIDPKKRKIYDETGRVEFSSLEEMDNVDDWLQYLNELWSNKITVEQIEEFKLQYQHSNEEKDDVIKAYNDSKGDMDYILENVLCCNVEDEDRFRDIIEEAIQEKKVKRYAKFKKNEKITKKRKKLAQDEAKEAEEYQKELGLDGSEQALAKLIKEKSEKRMNDLIENLEAKYVNKSEKTKKKKK
jgi:DnaJ family protein C protein 9